MAPDCTRRRFLQGSVALASLGLLAGCGQLPARQRPFRKRLIGYLVPDVVPTDSTRAFVEGMAALGYVDGENVEIVYRWAAGQEDRLPSLAAELVRARGDLIVASSAVAGRAAKDTTDSLPIVVIASNDPVAAGLVASLAHPGGNVTGLSLANPALIGKRVQLVKETLPHSSRVAALVYPSGATAQQDWDETNAAGQRLGLQVIRRDVPSPDEFDAAFSAITAASADALLVLPNMFFSRNRQRLIRVATELRVPTMFESRMYANDGGLLSYGADPVDLARRAATYVDKILKGTPPAELPVEQPTKFDFVINQKTAQVLGLTIPQSILQQATEVIQ
jgi:putative ABC transport system substrate-binding protein